MIEFQHGLIVGKFYPPHIGHHHLIRVAASRCARVTVVATASHVESIPLDDRVSWLREEHRSDLNVTVVGLPDDAPIDYDSEQAWAAHNAIFDAALRSAGATEVDAVFTGEAYGDRLAAHFNATHVAVHGAVRVPSNDGLAASGTACRADLPGTWSALAPATRAGLATRIVVLGAESTGTTTVSRALAARYRDRGGVWASTRWVAEYGRERSIEKLQEVRRGNPNADLAEVVWSAEDFLQIATVQTEREEEAAREGSPVLVCDTDAFATQVWERRYLGPKSSASSAAAVPRHDVYLVTDHVGVPFEQDGLRDGELIREEMTTWFLDALTRTGRSWVLLTGTVEQRVDMAEAIAARLLDQRTTFAGPLG